MNIGIDDGIYTTSILDFYAGTIKLNLISNISRHSSSNRHYTGVDNRHANPILSPLLSDRIANDYDCRAVIDRRHFSRTAEGIQFRFAGGLICTSLCVSTRDNHIYGIKYLSQLPWSGKSAGICDTIETIFSTIVNLSKECIRIIRLIFD